MGECRNCGAQTTRDLGFIGEIAPFFLKRVLNLEYNLAPSGHPLKRFLRRIGFLSQSFQKIYGKSVLVQCGWRPRRRLWCRAGSGVQVFQFWTTVRMALVPGPPGTSVPWPGP